MARGELGGGLEEGCDSTVAASGTIRRSGARGGAAAAIGGGSVKEAATQELGAADGELGHPILRASSALGARKTEGDGGGTDTTAASESNSGMTGGRRFRLTCGPEVSASGEREEGGDAWRDWLLSGPSAGVGCGHAAGPDAREKRDGA